MSYNYFNDVTGTNDYERQSWRDSHNGGRAAGDITGNINRRLDDERAAFQGATWSGSSTQYSALELAQRHAQVGYAGAGQGAGSPKSSGPGNEQVTQGPVTARVAAGGSGAASRLTVMGPGGPLIPSMDDKITQFMVMSRMMFPSPRSSNAAEIEDRWGDAEFLSPAFFANWGVAIDDVGYNLDVKRGGPFYTDKIMRDLGSIPSGISTGAAGFADYFAERAAAARDPFGPDFPVPGFSRGGF